MNPSIAFTSYVTVRHNRVMVDGVTVFEAKDAAAPAFLQQAYEHFQLNYPKFFKMDNFCKTGFLAAELLLRGKALSQTYTPEQTGVVMSNANGSLVTDIKYEATIATNPSPSLFVYTLPNVLIGEICIRNQIKGESACFVFDIFDASFQTDYVNILFETGKVKSCVSGWADYYNGKAEAFFYLAELTEEGTKHTAENVDAIWNNLNT